MRFTLTVGTAPYPPTRLINTTWAGFSTNRAYLCPQCGEVWARWRKENIDPLSLEDQWIAFHRSCPNHRLGWWLGDRPGSLILAPEDILVIPRPLLFRELSLMTATPSAEEEGTPLGGNNEQSA